MAITFDKLKFVVGESIILNGFTDNVDAVAISPVDGESYPIADGNFTLNFPALKVGSYSLSLKLLDADSKELESTSAALTIVAAGAEEPIEGTPVVVPEISAEAQALIDENSSTIQNYIPRYEVSIETNTDDISIYPGSKIGFGPISKSPNSATSADEFKIMSDEALAANPSAGFTGGRGTGNPDDFGKFPYRALMKDVRGEFFPKGGDFDANSPTQYPLGRTADLLENAVNPIGFTTKDKNGYSTSTTRGGVNASPLPTSGFTF